MRAFRTFSFATWVVGTALFAGCSKSPPPKPDGSSGIRGVCLLPAEPADADGQVPERKPWAGVTVIVSHTNISSDDPTWGLQYRTVADAEGKYELALNPGHYTVSPAFSELVKDVAIAPLPVKVEPGRFTEFVVDYDKFQMTKVRFKDR